MLSSFTAFLLYVMCISDETVEDYVCSTIVTISHLFICNSVVLLSISFCVSLVASTMGVSPFLAACHFG